MTAHAPIFDLPDDAATVAMGQVLAVTRPARGVVYLQGELGAGKSTLARAMLRALGVSGTIRSPTYTLVEDYLLDGGGRALHLDLYRIGEAGELEFLGLADVDPALWLVEWPERGAGALPAPDLLVELDVEGSGRRARCEPRSPAGTAWIDRAACDDRLRPLVAVT